MLVPRRIWRRRIWRDFCHSMAAIMGLSVLLCFCGSVFRVSTNPTGRPESEGVDSEPASTSYGEYIIHYGATSVNLHRHNRALQFMDSKKFGGDVSDSNEVAERRDQQQNNHALRRDVSHLNQRLDFVSDQPPPNSNVNMGSRTDHSLHPSTHQVVDLTRASPQPDLSTSPNSGRVPNSLDGAGFRNDTRVFASKDNQLGKIAPYFPGKENKARQVLNHSEVQSKRLPRAIIIGVKKAGTRALLEFLRLHPDVEGTGPEPHFFDRNYDKGLQWYRDHMPDTRKHQMTIEKTPGYFVTRDAPRRIFEMDPSMKLILVVRDPVTRAISDYCQAVSKHAMKPFEEMALLDEHLGLVNTSWGAIRIGVYAKHMEHWLQVFSLGQIHLVDGQKLVEEPAREVAKVETFLGLPKYINDSHFYLRGFKGTFPCLIREGKPHCLDEKSKGRDHPVVKESVLQRLRDFFRPFNAKFYQMVGRNFEWSS